MHFSVKIFQYTNRHILKLTYLSPTEHTCYTTNFLPRHRTSLSGTLHISDSPAQIFRLQRYVFGAHTLIKANVLRGSTPRHEGENLGSLHPRNLIHLMFLHSCKKQKEFKKLLLVRKVDFENLVSEKGKNRHLCNA